MLGVDYELIIDHNTKQHYSKEVTSFHATHTNIYIYSCLLSKDPKHTFNAWKLLSVLCAASNGMYCSVEKVLLINKPFPSIQPKSVSGNSRIWDVTSAGILLLVKGELTLCD